MNDRETLELLNNESIDKNVYVSTVSLNFTVRIIANGTFITIYCPVKNIVTFLYIYVFCIYYMRTVKVISIR